VGFLEAIICQIPLAIVEVSRIQVTMWIQTSRMGEVVVFFLPVSAKSTQPTSLRQLSLQQVQIGGLHCGSSPETQQVASQQHCQVPSLSISPLAVALNTMLPPKTVVTQALQAALMKHHHRIWLQHPVAAERSGSS